MFSFRLFVAGSAERCAAAQANLRALCESRLPGSYELEVVNVADRPDLAEEGRILAVPTVIRLSPPPQLRVIGDLSDHDRAALALALPVHPGPARVRETPRRRDGGTRTDTDGESSAR